MTSGKAATLGSSARPLPKRNQLRTGGHEPAVLLGRVLISFAPLVSWHGLPLSNHRYREPCPTNASQLGTTMSRQRQAQWTSRFQQLQALRARFMGAGQYHSAHKAHRVVQRMYERWANEVFATARIR